MDTNSIGRPAVKKTNSACYCGGLCDSGHPCPMAYTAPCAIGQPMGQTGPIAAAVIAAINQGADECWPYFLAEFDSDLIEAMDFAMTRDESVKERAA